MTSGLRTPRRGIGAGRLALTTAREFYCDVLGGRQMRRLQLDDGSSMFTFLVGDELVTTGPGVADERVTLVVDDALAIAERCWDAGFEVRVREAADETTIVVVDPFDRELEVITSSGAVESASRHEVAGGEVSTPTFSEPVPTDRQPHTTRSVRGKSPDRRESS